MTFTIEDIDRPDVNGTLPKMHAIAEAIEAKVAELPELNIRVSCDDNLCSGIDIEGNFTPKEQWANGIYRNGKYFCFAISPKDKRYYQDGDQVTVELTSKSYKITKKFRKYSGTPDKVIAKIIDWIKA